MLFRPLSAFDSFRMMAAREALAAAARALGRSIQALWRTTAVWLALAVLCFGAFVLGHLEASHGKRLIRDRMQAAEALAASRAVERDAAVAEVKRLTAALAERASAPPPPPAPRRKRSVNLFPGGKE